MIEASQQIGAVRRNIGSRVIDGGEMRTLTISQCYDTTVQDLWDACTTAGRLARWFVPVTGDLRPGGRFQVEGNASGTIEQCDPPHGFAATWEFGGQVSWIEVRLSSQPDGQARIELEHIAKADDATWAEFGPGALGIGWDMTLLGLASHLPGGQAADRGEAAAWMASADGRRFIELSSQRWRDADIAAGTSEADADAAAGRCTAAYTGGAG